jgi:hypothetical protein
MRVIEVMPPDTSAGAYLKELAQANIKFKTKGVRAFGQWFSRRCGQVGMSLSCYAARHAFASEQKARLPRSISTPSAFESLIERDASNLIADARAETHAAQIADSLGHASDRTQDFYGAAGLAGKGGGFKTISASAEGKPRMSRTKARASASAILSPAGSPSLATADCDELPGDSLKLKP